MLEINQIFSIYIMVCNANKHPPTNAFVVAEFLVKFLEQEVCRLNWDVGFVTATMQEIGVQLPRLLEVYDQLFKTRVRIEISCLIPVLFPGVCIVNYWQHLPIRDSLSLNPHDVLLPFCLKDPCWQRLRKPLHLVECIHVLLSGYVDDPSKVPTYDR